MKIALISLVVAGAQAVSVTQFLQALGQVTVEQFEEIERGTSEELQCEEKQGTNNYNWGFSQDACACVIQWKVNKPSPNWDCYKNNKRSSELETEVNPIGKTKATYCITEEELATFAVHDLGPNCDGTSGNGVDDGDGFDFFDCTPGVDDDCDDDADEDSSDSITIEVPGISDADITRLIEAGLPVILNINSELANVTFNQYVQPE